MATHTEAAPQPTGNADPGRFEWPRLRGFALPKPRPLPGLLFADVLRARTSRPGTISPSLQQLSDVLWYSNFVRVRKPPLDRARGWESRNSPAAGGLHGLETLILPMDDPTSCGWYDPIGHQVHSLCDANAVVTANAYNVIELCGAIAGITLQFISDRRRLDVLYENGETLMWRDAGALIATTALVATSVGVQATPLGRIGVPGWSPNPASSEDEWAAAGAVHLTAVDEI